MNDELVAWLRLTHTPGLGRDAARRLLARFSSPEAAVAATHDARHAVAGAAGALLDVPPPHFDALLHRTASWLAGATPEAPRHTVAFGASDYPRALAQTVDPPLLLYLHGRTALLRARSVAIVGSRNPTAQGEDAGRRFAAHLSQAGWTIVSGLALGIDSAAHEGGLQGPGNTIAVVGTGPDQVFPHRNQALAQRILAEGGLFVSEYAPGEPALPSNFALRNRIIAGLARGTLVVEAALDSGSMITARLATEAGRELFAIPGSIHNPLARGCHALIKKGAKLVEDVTDVLQQLQPGTELPATPVDERSPRDPLLQALGDAPMTLDALVERTGWPAQELSARLLELELDGQVARLPGQLFLRLLRV